MAAWVEASTRDLSPSAALISQSKTSLSASLLSGDAGKPALAPKPRLMPKPFAFQRNATIRPIKAPKITSARQLQRAASSDALDSLASSKSELVETRVQNTSESAKPNGTLKVSVKSASTKPAPLGPKPALTPKRDLGQNPDTTRMAPNTKPEDDKNFQSRARAKSLGSQEHKALRQTPKGESRSGDADFRASSLCWPVRNRLSVGLTSRFESPEREVGSVRRDEAPLSPSESKPQEDEETSGTSIKRRISLLFDRSAASQHRDVFIKKDSAPAEISVDIKQRIKNLSLNTQEPRVRLPSTEDLKCLPNEKTPSNTAQSSPLQNGPAKTTASENNVSRKNSTLSSADDEEEEEEKDDDAADEDKENCVSVPVYRRVGMAGMAKDPERKTQEEEKEKQHKDEQLQKERERDKHLEEEKKLIEKMERRQEEERLKEERKQEEEKQRQREERRKQELERQKIIEEERKLEEGRAREAERETRREQERLERDKQIEEQKRRMEEKREKERQREEQRLREEREKERLRKEKEMEEERQRIEEERQREKLRLRQEREKQEMIKKEREIEEKKRIEEEERLRREKENQERLKKEREMEEKRRLEEQRLRQEREKEERLKKEREMEERKQLEEQRLRQEREKEERLKKEREMEERKQLEEQRLRQEREKEERLKKEREMEERKQLEEQRLRLERAKEERLKKEREIEERKRVEEEEQLRQEREMERIRKEREMEERRHLEEQRLRQEREKEERLKKAREMEERRQLEEQRLRQEREKEERFKKDREMEEKRLLEEQRLRLERAKEERLKKEREMEERKQIEEEERLRLEREMERIRKAGEMEERRRLEEQRLRQEREITERLKKEREMEEKRQLEEQRLRQEREKERQRKEKEMEEKRQIEEEQRLRQQREMERLRKEREMEEKREEREEKLKQEREMEERMRVEDEKRWRQEREKARLRMERDNVAVRRDLISFDGDETQSEVSSQLPGVLYDDFSVKPRRWGTGTSRSSTPSPSGEAPSDDAVHDWMESNDPESPRLQKPQNSTGEDETNPQTSRSTPDHGTSQQGELKNCPDDDDEEDEDEYEDERDTEMRIPHESNNTDVDGFADNKINQLLQRLTSQEKQRKPSIESDAPEITDPEPLLFPKSSAPLLDSSVFRSKADLGKKRSIKRSRPSRSVRQRAALPALIEGSNLDWRFCDSSDGAKAQNSESGEEPSKYATPPPAPSRPKRVPMFPGMDQSALMAQLKRRSGLMETDVSEGQTTPAVSARSPRTPTLGPRVLPPVNSRDTGSGSSPSWLRELKSKKRLSRPESDA